MPLKLADPALAQVIAIVLLLLLGLHLAADREGVAPGRDLNILGPHAWQRCFHDELVLILGDVQG